MERGFVTLVAALQDTAQSPLPAQPTIQGPGWTAWVPGLIFLVLAFATWAFWRHFAAKDD